EFAEQIIKTLPGRYHISIPKYVIMPNHIHLIIEIDDERRAIRESPLQRSVIDQAMGYLKMNVSKRIHRTYNEKIWQRSYHDHIIRTEKDYRKIWEYINTNPAKWEEDCFYHE
ncbi:MAG: transposase, partial [Clostridia bacterium]|nr:transposase [Clostridia bacterium]